MSPLKILAALLIVSAGVVLFAVEDLKLTSILLIAGNLLALFDRRRDEPKA